MNDVKVWVAAFAGMTTVKKDKHKHAFCSKEKWMLDVN